MVDFHRLFGRPDYFIRVAVADQAVFETLLTSRLMSLQAVARVDSHMIMKTIKTHD